MPTETARCPLITFGQDNVYHVVGLTPAREGFVYVVSGPTGAAGTPDDAIKAEVRLRFTTPEPLDELIRDLTWLRREMTGKDA